MSMRVLHFTKYFYADISCNYQGKKYPLKCKEMRAQQTDQGHRLFGRNPWNRVARYWCRVRMMDWEVGVTGIWQQS